MFGFIKKTKTGDRGEPLPTDHNGPPDTHRPYGLCPRCGKQSSFQIAGSIPVTFEGSYIAERDGSKTPMHSDQVSSLICRNCGQGTVVVEEKWIGESPHSVQRAGGVINFRGIHWWPLPQASISTDIPAEIADAYREAVVCLSANAYRAAVAMARRSLEAIAVDQGETNGVLAVRLKNLADRNVLQPSLADWAKEVRLIGNIGAHFDPINAVSKEDASDLIAFIRELLRYLYEMPADLARRRQGST